MVVNRSVRAWLSGPASRARVPVFVARGVGAGHALDALRLRPELRFVDSPRQASVLLVAGRITDALAQPLAQVHDQVPRPRATVWWTSGDVDGVPDDGAVVVSNEADVVARLIATHSGLTRGTKAGEPPLLPDRDPAEWRGVGPYGQGGTGMTGGVPYGRQIAGRTDDLRDGLALDVIVQRMGPFLTPFPAGLVLEATIQGDIVQAALASPASASDGGHPEAQPPRGGGALPDPDRAPFVQGRSEPVPVSVLEVARARHHLRWVASCLRLYGMDALALRVLRLASSLIPSDADAVRDLARRLDRPWVLGAVTAGVGRMDPETAVAFGGPVARSAGVDVDPRARMPAYRALGFAPVVCSGGDVRARWRQRMAEAEQSLDLAARAGHATLDADPDLEPPWTTAVGLDADRDLTPQVAGLLVGLEWGDALATLVSLDLDLEDRLAAGIDVPA